MAKPELSAPLISVILSTYNRPDALRLVLEGYQRVGGSRFELIVADDGSAPETGEEVRRFALTAGFPVKHVRHADDGFRLAAIRNLGVRAAEGSVLLFTDGDCVPFPEALGAHSLCCEPGRALAGGKCCLEEQETGAALSAGAIPAELFEGAYRRGRGRLRRLEWKNRFYRWTRSKPRPKLTTCNAAVHRSDFENVNGFDEQFVGWGYEDEDLARRLRRCGVRVLDATTRSLVLHLFHKVHASHRPDSRSSPNYHYFKSGRYLTRPLRGLQGRPLEALSVELLGAFPQPLLDAVPPITGVPDISLVRGRRPLSLRPRGEVVLAVPDDATMSSMDDVYQLVVEAL